MATKGWVHFDLICDIRILLTNLLDGLKLFFDVCIEFELVLVPLNLIEGIYLLLVI